MNYHNQMVKVTNLSINTENPRFEMVSNQHEAIAVMIENQKSKIEKLGRHIVLNGVNPADLVIVTPDASNKGHYIVLEGNRRVTTLKLLNNPNLINEKHKSTLNKFLKMKESFKANPIESIPCVIFTDEDDAYKWIKLKHTGENSGVGTVSWNSQQQARFEQRNEGKASYALQVIEFLQKDESFDSKLKEKLPTLKSTSLQRLIGDPDIRNIIGINIREGQITSKLPPSEIVKPLTKVIRDLTNKNFKVKDIYNKSDRLNYIETFKNSELPETESSIGEWEVTTSTPPKSKPTSKKRSKPLSTNRHNIIPKSCVIHISQPKVNKIYRELKDLDLRYFVNAGAILFRVFIELSIDCYMETHKIPMPKKETLANKVQDVTNHMIENGTVTKHEAKPINTAVSSQHSLLSINTFNAYVHNKHFSPLPKDLKVTWDGFEKYMSNLWEAI